MVRLCSQANGKSFGTVEEGRAGSRIFAAEKESIVQEGESQLELNPEGNAWGACLDGATSFARG